MEKILLLLTILLVSCSNIPDNINPVDNFKVGSYLGKWYEIARLDHSFERGLKNVTADYSLRDDGGIQVVNRGYLPKENKCKEARGRAYFVNRQDHGLLKVSFFGPFYGSYVIFDLDHEKYSYALICGPNKSYLWLLSRSPQIHEIVKNKLIAKATALGFDTSKLIFVQQDEYK
jgi:apolipoprotein D and lipocalin family protein